MVNQKVLSASYGEFETRGSHEEENYKVRRQVGGACEE